MLSVPGAVAHEAHGEALQCVSSHFPEGGVPSGTVRRRCCWVEMLVGGEEWVFCGGGPLLEELAWREGLLGSDRIVKQTIDQLESVRIDSGLPV